MRGSVSFIGSVIAGLGVLSSAVQATECAKFSFLVNDYGKDGPTKDAQDLLDKTIVKWASDNKITKYKVGPKNTTCELFLIIPEEYTCTAEAPVCVDGKMPANMDLIPIPASMTTTAPKAAGAKPAKAASASATTTPAKPVTTTGSTAAPKASQ